jgi:hypothetical protein
MPLEGASIAGGQKRSCRSRAVAAGFSQTPVAEGSLWTVDGRHPLPASQSK